jgi:excisionase family DNA binding protein
MIELEGKKYYTTKEVSEKLNLHLRTIQNWVKEKKLIPFKFGPRKFYYDEAAIARCLKGE